LHKIRGFAPFSSFYTKILEKFVQNRENKIRRIAQKDLLNFVQLAKNFGGIHKDSGLGSDFFVQNAQNQKW
jgi:hypothetical protein